MIPRRGFTLVELVVVVAVIATLSALGAGYYFEYIEDARVAVVKNNIKVVREALARHFKDRLVYPTLLESLQGPFIQQSPRTLLIDAWGGASVSMFVEVPDTAAGADANAFLATKTTIIYYPVGGGGNTKQIKNVLLKRDDTMLPW